MLTPSSVRRDRWRRLESAGGGRRLQRLAPKFFVFEFVADGRSSGSVAGRAGDVGGAGLDGSSVDAAARNRVRLAPCTHASGVWCRSPGTRCERRLRSRTPPTHDPVVVVDAAGRERATGYQPRLRRVAPPEQHGVSGVLLRSSAERWRACLRHARRAPRYSRWREGRGSVGGAG